MARSGGRLHAPHDAGKFLTHYLWQEEEEEKGRGEGRDGWREKKKNTKQQAGRPMGCCLGLPRLAPAVRDLITMELVYSHLFLLDSLK